MFAVGQLPTHDEAAFSEMQTQPEAERRVPTVRVSALSETDMALVPSACGVLVRQFYTLASSGNDLVSPRPPQPPQLVERKRRADWPIGSVTKRVR